MLYAHYAVDVTDKDQQDCEDIEKDKKQYDDFREWGLMISTYDPNIIIDINVVVIFL